MSFDLPLTDFHVHTWHSYCAPESDPAQVVEAALNSGVQQVVIVCHSGQLYAGREQYWSGGILREPELMYAARQEGTDRVRQFLDDIMPFRSERVLVGLEIDCDMEGNMIVLKEDLPYFDYLLGSIHFVEDSELWETQPARAAHKFLDLHRRFLTGSGINILAHPFRPLVSSGITPTRLLAEGLAEIALKVGVAVEMNFHNNHTPYRPFVRACMERGVPISLGSDAHKVCEVCDLEPHRTMLEELGVRPEHLFQAATTKSTGR